MSRWAVQVVWKDGSTELVAQGAVDAIFRTRKKATELRDFMLIGMSDEVQSINVINLFRSGAARRAGCEET